MGLPGLKVQCLCIAVGTVLIYRNCVLVGLHILHLRLAGSGRLRGSQLLAVDEAS